ncbi:hypothetical protein TL16_g11945 [Triparma laevis f. inornata]|uniref:Uncharacterized protein n=1 Tax=Triparma laevis f. inornata TaxID=1714386 RepID=A0A9W7ESD8_9STRA|nr:hypothetical protein TL16_g11945 [Triparma laevis f. inornata]
MLTPDFWRHFIEYTPGDMLMTLRLETKGYRDAADALIDKGVECGAIIVHDGKYIRFGDDDEVLEERRVLVTRVIFLLNVTKVGFRACLHAVNLVVVDIP